VEKIMGIKDNAPGKGGFTQQQEPKLPMSQLLRNATNQYRFTTPYGDVWCPYVMNGGPFRPNPRNGVLKRRGAGKIKAVEFQIAAQHAYDQVMIDGVNDHPSVPEAVRARLVNGSLPKDNHNYTGIDCSGLVVNVLDHAVKQSGGGDIYEALVVPDEEVVNMLDSMLDPGKKAVLEHARSSGGFNIREYARTIRGHNKPARAVNVARLVTNSTFVEGTDIQPGDLAFYTNTDFRRPHHVALVLDTEGRDGVIFAHSGRRDPEVEIGGVEIFSLPHESVFNRELIHDQRGRMAIRRLDTLAS
jgi:cell wall-associated NlpC family hydrolase